MEGEKSFKMPGRIIKKKKKNLVAKRWAETILICILEYIFGQPRESDGAWGCLCE